MQTLAHLIIQIVKMKLYYKDSISKKTCQLSPQYYNIVDGEKDLYAALSSC